MTDKSGMAGSAVDIYFSDYFNVSPATLDHYGAFNISLVNDLPLFVDPFLLFNSEKPEYLQLHEEIIKYLVFLRDTAQHISLPKGLRATLYQFPEVKQNWLGFSKIGNQGTGLGPRFGTALHHNLGDIFSKFGQEDVTLGSHLEKVCLIDDGVGRDNISDFTTRLILDYLLQYTQAFATQHVDVTQRTRFAVAKAKFNYSTKSWMTLQYELPCHNGDFVILTPKDMLTKDQMWISKHALHRNIEQIAEAIPDDQLRHQLSEYLRERLADAADMDRDEREEYQRRITAEAIRRFPLVVDYYIRSREEDGEEAESISAANVSEVRSVYIDHVIDVLSQSSPGGEFFQHPINTADETRERLLHFRDWVENRDGYRLFYIDGKMVTSEEMINLLFKLLWYGSPSDFNSEVNNGRGPVDHKVSRGSKDKTLVEFKLAKNPKLERALQKQLKVYEAANGTSKSFWAICYFSDRELDRVNRLLRNLGMQHEPNIILIDCRSDNKPSASTA